MKIRKNIQLIGDQKVASAIATHLGRTKQLKLLGRTYDPQALRRLFLHRIEVTAQAEAAEARWHAAVNAQREAEAEIEPLRRALKALVIATFGEASEVLSDFGFAAPKAARASAETKAVAAGKRRATRAARRTSVPAAEEASRTPSVAAPKEGGAVAAAN